MPRASKTVTLSNETQLDRETILRFYSKLVWEMNGCVTWTAGITNGGYGNFAVSRNSLSTQGYAHRWSWVISGGRLMPGLFLDHTCRNRLCVNPRHLRQVSPRVNALENNISIVAINSKKTHCLRGHVLTEDNLRITNRHEGRRCRTCDNINYEKRKERDRLVKRRRDETINE